jgi:hypothetical protein
MLFAANCYTDAYGIWPLASAAVIACGVLIWNRPLSRLLAEFIGPWRGNPAGRKRDELDDLVAFTVARVALVVMALFAIGISIYAVLAGCAPND